MTSARHMTDTPLDRIIKRTGKALRIPQEIILSKKKRERAKPPKDDLSEKAFAKQIDEILTGKKDDRPKPQEKDPISDDEVPF